MIFILLLGVALIGFATAQWALAEYSPRRLERYLASRRPGLAAQVGRHERSTLLALRGMTWVLGIGLALALVYRWNRELVGAPEANWPRWLEGAARALVAVLVVILVDLWIARPIGRRFAERVLGLSWPVLTAARYLATPLSAVSLFLDRVVEWLRPRGAWEEPELPPSHEEILSAVTEGEREGAIREDAAQMIVGLMDLHQIEVGSIMTPRPDVFMLRASTPIRQARVEVYERGHSRVPVYLESRDQIAGILYAKDLLPFGDESPDSDRTLASLAMRQPVYVRASMPVDDLLREFRRGRVHVALVVDEYGGVAGLVTFEDILEQIVGEIADEFDTAEPPPVRRIDDHTIQVDARAPVDELNELFPLGLPEDGDYETLGGFLSAWLGRIPRVGETIDHAHARFTVLDGTDRAVGRLLVELRAPGPEGPEGAEGAEGASGREDAIEGNGAAETRESEGIGARGD